MQNPSSTYAIAAHKNVKHEAISKQKAFSFFLLVFTRRTVFLTVIFLLSIQMSVSFFVCVCVCVCVCACVCVCV